MDGLSVAASVVGIIQATKSLIDYIEAYKGQEPQIANIATNLGNHIVVFENLRKLLTDRKFRADEKSLLERIESSIQMCEENIQGLQTKIEKFKKGTGNSFRVTLQTTTRQLAYPFEKGTLQNVQADIDKIVTNLSLALRVLQQKDIGNVKAELDLVRATQISSTIRSWLHAPDANSNYIEACKLQHPGTGLWLVEGDSFSTWLVKANSFLWLNGFAGCGKSVICSRAIQYTLRHRISNPCIGIAFFFFTFSDDSKEDASAMLRALILQLSEQLDDKDAPLSQLYDRHRNGTPPDQELEYCLELLVKRFKHVYIILDALDESPRNKHGKNLRRGVLEALVLIRKWSETDLRLLVTSRDENDIRDVLHDDLHTQPDEIISMDNTSVDSDIALFISGYLKDSRELRKLGEYHDQIKKALVKRAGGVFRWVECQLRELSNCRSKRQLDASLASLPEGLDETYERMLLSIDKASVQDARRILTLLCCAKSPLTVPELIEATAVELGDNPRLNPDGRLFGEDAIRAVCSGLIKVDEHRFRRTVRIAHFSVQEYLESNRILEQDAHIFSVRSPEAHAEITSICLIYLLEPGLSRASIAEYPFAMYAARTWYNHFRDGDKSKHDVEQNVLQFFRNPRGRFETWITVWDVEYNYGGMPLGKVASSVYYASLLGLSWVLSQLLSENPCASSCSALSLQDISDLVNAQGGLYRNALQAASVNGHEQIVKFLLDKGADVNAQSGYYGTALQAASAKGHEQIVKLLLDKGADVDVDAQSGYYGTALQAALVQHHEQIVKLLLDKGADVNSQDENHWNALYKASDASHEQIVKLLLDKVARIGYSDALQVASTKGHEQIVKLLVDKNPLIKAQGGGLYDNALQAASAEGHEQIVKLLLDKGADVNGHGYYGTALMAASLTGHEQIVKLLLNKGADINAKDGKYTALYCASCHGNEQIVKLLLENKGIDVKTQDQYFGDALRVASHQGYQHIVKLLLDKCIDINAQIRYYGNALPVAADAGHEQIVKFLLDHKCFKINSQDGYYSKALYVASMNGYEQIVKLLLDDGTEINVQSAYGNALGVASAVGHKHIVKLLLDNKCFKINSQDEYYGNALFAASMKGYEQIVKLLLDNGTEINVQSAYGNALRMASALGHKHIVKLLLDKGANVNAQGEECVDVS